MLGEGLQIADAFGPIACWSETSAAIAADVHKVSTCRLDIVSDGQYYRLGVAPGRVSPLKQSFILHQQVTSPMTGL